MVVDGETIVSDFSTDVRPKVSGRMIAFGLIFAGVMAFAVYPQAFPRLGSDNEHVRVVEFFIWFDPPDATIAVTVKLGPLPRPPYAVKGTQATQGTPWRMKGAASPGSEVSAIGMTNYTITYSSCAITIDNTFVVGSTANGGLWKDCRTIV